MCKPQVSRSYECNKGLINTKNVAKERTCRYVTGAKASSKREAAPEGPHSECKFELQWQSHNAGRRKNKGKAGVVSEKFRRKELID